MQHIQSLTLAVIILVSIPALAHDPKEHVKAGEAPDCQALATMDHSNMSMDDPVMQAMLAKCPATMMEDHADDHDPAAKETQANDHSAHSDHH